MAQVKKTGRKKKNEHPSDYPSSSSQELPPYEDNDEKQEEETSESRSTFRFDKPTPKIPAVGTGDNDDNGYSDEDDDNGEYKNDDNGEYNNDDNGYSDENDNNYNNGHENKEEEGSCEKEKLKKIVKKNKILKQKAKIMKLQHERYELMLKMKDIDRMIEIERLRLKYMK